MSAEQFDAHYYATGCGAIPYGRNPEWLALFDLFAAKIASHIEPTTVLDAGCAFGLLVESLRARGMEADGIDISEYALTQAADSIKPFLRQGSIAAPLHRRYDLIVCIEVVEHMPQGEAELAIANFCEHSDDILFSSSPHDFTEATHINVHPVDYWAALFATHGFYRDLDFDAAFIAPWAARFRKISAPKSQIVQTYERHLWLHRDEATQLRAELAKLRRELGESNIAIAQLRSDVDTLSSHNTVLTNLISGYENGRFIRLMRRLRGR